jgi:hypothetical protein
MPDAPALTCSHKLILVGDVKGKRSRGPGDAAAAMYVSRVRFAGGELDGLEVAAASADVVDEDGHLVSFELTR